MNYSYRNETSIYGRSHMTATKRNSDNIEKELKKIKHMTGIMLQFSMKIHT
jgi:hypothetical protein